MNWLMYPGVLLLVVMIPCFRQSAAAEAPNGPLNAEQVVDNLVQKNIERARALMSYEGTRIYRLEYYGFPGSREAEMVVDVRYQAPATKEFTVRSETGSKLLIERVFKKLLQTEKEALAEENQKRTALNPDNYVFTMASYEITKDGPVY